MTSTPWLLVVGVLMAFSIPGPCGYDTHPELDCGDGQRCPDGLACARDGFCKDPDIACDSFPDNELPGGGVNCDGVCVSRDSLSSDVENCGACGVSCGENEACCDGACVVADNDARCGACDVSCAPNETCVDLQCATTCTQESDCLTGQGCCDGFCLTLASDDHCGACDAACGADQRCAAGEGSIGCVDTCDGDEDCGQGHCCGGVCTLPDDGANCLGCGQGCDVDQVCEAGACVAECGVGRDCANASETCCTDNCVDITSDDDNCGACDDACPGTAFCADSTCHDGTEIDCCGSQCRDCAAQGDRCSGGICQDCDFVSQNCGPDYSCVPNFLALPQLVGTCIIGAPDPAPQRYEDCIATAGSSDCDDGLDCQSVNADFQVCIRYCDVGSRQGCDTATEVCAPVAPNAPVGLCLPRCDLSASVQCSFNGVIGNCVPMQNLPCVDGAACVPPGPLQEGQACTQGTPDCAAGLACDDDGTCHRTCQNLSQACAGGGTCQPLLNSGQCNAGVCR